MSRIRSHIDRFPKMPSHYNRARSKRLYFYPGLNIRKLYRLYVEKCEEDGIAPQKENVYRKVFNSYDPPLAFHVPKKDQCTSCNNCTNSNNEEKTGLQKDYDDHIRRKNEANADKKKDMLESSTVKTDQITCAFDLQVRI